MIIIPYVLLFAVFLALSAKMCNVLTSGHDSSKGKDKTWAIGKRSYLAYALLAACAAGFLTLNPIIAAVLGLCAGIFGPMVSFLIAMMTSPNGVK